MANMNATKGQVKATRDPAPANKGNVSGPVAASKCPVLTDRDIGHMKPVKQMSDVHPNNKK